MIPAVKEPTPQRQKTDNILPPELAPVLAPVLDLFAELVNRLTPQSGGDRLITAAWITIDQAAEYSGLSAGLLRRLVAAGRIRGIVDGRTKLRRADLDSFDPALLQGLPTRLQLRKKAKR